MDDHRISVTDIVTTTSPDGLRTQISSYPKLRIAPAAVAAWAATTGLALDHQSSEQGMVVQRLRRA